MQVVHVPEDRIQPNPWQTREGLDPVHVAALAGDIKVNGLMQPPVARLVLNGKALDPALYGGVEAALLDEPEAVVQLAIGHNRVAAYRNLGDRDPAYRTVPIQIRVLNDHEMARMAWSENAARKDLNPVEEATAIQRVQAAFGWTQDQVAEQFGLNRATVANKLRLIRLPQELVEKLRKGELSERKALALLPLIELPEAAREQAERIWKSSSRPTQILAEAAKMSSDQLRTSVSEAIAAGTLSFNDLPFVEHVFDDLEGVQAAACTTCEVKLRRGSIWRCPDRDCAATKRAAWINVYLAPAVEALGHPSGGEFEYSCTRLYNGDLEMLKEAPCENVRVMFKQDPYEPIPDFPNVVLACNQGNCACKTARRKAAEKAEREAANAKKQAVKDKVVTPASLAVANALVHDNPKVWYAISRPTYGTSQVREGWSAERIRLAMARQLVEAKIPWQGQENLEVAQTAVGAWLKALGLPIPWEEDPLIKVEQRLARIEQWVVDLFDVEEADFVELEPAIRGNLDNLQRLWDEALPEGPSEKLQTRFAIANDALQTALLQVYGEVTPA